MFLVWVVLGQLEASAAAVTAGDKLLSAALCHLHSSLVLIHKLTAILILS